MTEVATPTKEYERLSALWALPRTLMGGTKAMRKAGVAYLPQEAAESALAYDARLKRSTLFNGFRKTVKDMTGKVFQREVMLGDDVPAQIQGFAENIDLAGRHLNVFARDAFYDSMQTGIGYIFVDMPGPVTRADGRPATRADEQTSGNRPYFCYIKAEDLIGWKSETIAGVVTLTQVRIREEAHEPDGEYGERCVPQIRVLEPGKWQIWRQADEGADKGKWTLYQSGTTSLKKIALAPVYINRTGFMCGEPPLEDLADLNVAHWQSQSDQRNILHVARVPILFGAGFTEDDKIEIGASRMVRASAAEATLEYVEHTGQAIGAGDTDLKNLEFQMQTQGLQLLIPQPGGKTATGEVADDRKENSPLAMMANALGDALEQAFGFAAEYLNLGEDKGGSVTVNTDFGLSLNGSQDLSSITTARIAGEISRETYWEILSGLGMLPGAFDPEVEASRLQSEPPSLGANTTPMDLGAPPNG